MKHLATIILLLMSFFVNGQRNNLYKFSYSKNGSDFMPIESGFQKDISRNDVVRLSIRDRNNKVCFYDSCVVLVYDVNDVKEIGAAYEATIKSNDGEITFDFKSFFSKCNCDRIDLKLGWLYYKTRNGKKDVIFLDQSKRTFKFFLNAQ